MTRFAALALLLAAPAMAQDQLPPLPEWGQVGAWVIRIDPEAGNGCLMERNFPDGTFVQIGALPKVGRAFIGAYNIIWTDIRDGQRDAVSFAFADRAFSGQVVGDHRGYLQGGQVLFDNDKFLEELVQARRVTITGPSGGMVEIDLTGTAKGIAAVRDCQSAQG